MRQLRARLWILGILGASIGCTDTTDSTVATEDVDIPTSVTVSPQAFLGSVPCSNEMGALHSYVATLTDLGLDPTVDAPFVLPSSPPVPCSDNVVFRYIVVGHTYTATIAGYDRYASELTPSGNASSGSGTMLQGGKVVSPRWTTSCPDGAIARLNDEVILTAQDCAPLQGMSALSAGLRVDPGAALGLLACKDPEEKDPAKDKGKVVSFVVTPKDSALPELTGLSCGSRTQACPKDALCVADYPKNVDAARTYTFAVHALTADGNKLSASCLAKAQAGLIVTAVCDPLTLDTK